MFQLKKQSVFFAGLIALIYIAAWVIQDELFLNWDVGHLLHASELLLAGGTYLHDFFIPNPPLILYLYAPPVLFYKFLGLKLILGFSLYIFLLATISLGLCFPLIQKIFSKDAVMGNIFFSILAALFLLVPLYDFGQRDHLLFMLSMPYLLLVTSRLQGVPILSSYALLLGFIAALGFGIKPQFLLTPVLVELYYMFREKTYRSCWRPEVFAILALLASYALATFLFYPDFIFVVAPYVLRNYYGSVGSSNHDLFLNNTVVFCYFTILFYAFQYKNDVYKNLSTVLLVALLGFLYAYLSQRTTFYYHLIPALSAAILLLFFYFTQFVRKPCLLRSDYVRMAIPALFLLGFLVYIVKVIWVMLFFAPLTTFTFFGVLFLVLLYAVQRNKHLGKMLGSLSFLLAFSYFSLYLAKGTPGFSSHQFLIVLFTLVILFGLMASRDYQGIGANLFLAALGLILFIYPAFFAYCVYWRSVDYKQHVLGGLITFMSTQEPHRSIYAFSIGTNISSPLVYYTDSILAQRIDCLWPVIYTLKATERTALPQSGLASHQKRIADENFFMNLIADDLHSQKPDLVFVDRKTRYIELGDHFDYLVYFSRNEKFRNEWKAYHFIKELSDHPFYRIGVYERVRA